MASASTRSRPGSRIPRSRGTVTARRSWRRWHGRSRSGAWPSPTTSPPWSSSSPATREGKDMLRLLATVALVLVLGVTWPTVSEGQSRPEESLTRPADSGWEVSLETRLGIPSGYVRVGEGSLRGTRLRLHDDLGIDVSEALEASVALHVTPRDALRATYLYYFLDGGARVDPTASFNGDGFGPGHVHINADFYRVSLDYERLLMSDYGAFLTGSIGLTYVHLRSEEHTSELQSLAYLVCRLLLEKKKKSTRITASLRSDSMY